MKPPMFDDLKAIELTQGERHELEEGTHCSSGLMCRGLAVGNYPAHVGWYLDVNENGYDVGRDAYAWRFENDPLRGVYCEDCTLTIEEELGRGPRR
jgi:hypothetical protein